MEISKISGLGSIPSTPASYNMAKTKSKKIPLILTYIALAVIFLVLFWHLFIPRGFAFGPDLVYTVKKGMGAQEISKELAAKGIIRQAWFFDGYIMVSGNYSELQAGTYLVSPSMSVFEIVKKMTNGNVIKNTVTVFEGWDIGDIATFLDKKDLFKREDILAAVQKDYYHTFEFLKDKPKKMDLEGYVFPDTYQLSDDVTADQFVQTALRNFDRKLTPELRQEIAKQKLSLYNVIIMASMLEKEVPTLEDKKIVAGILYKRLEVGMPLQVDATVNYVTGKHDPSVTKKDTAVDSPYNTYKYYGLPIGPISNPGMDSILAAIYPEKSAYWFYLSDPATRKTIFSKNLDQHNAAIAKYLR
jgi:UPF0755 protein